MTQRNVLTDVRLAGLDHLRLVVVIGVVVLHAAMSYMAFAPEWWYVVDPPGSLLFTLLVLAIDVPIMPMLFLLAGYFAWSSLVRRGSRSFLAAKFRRVALPWIAGTFILAPPTAYLMLLSRGSDIGLWEFWSGPYWGVFYQQSVYWFLGLLFMLFLATASIGAIPPVRRWMIRDVQNCSESSRRRRYGRLAAFWLLTALLFFVVHRSVPLDSWRNWGYLLMVQPNRVPLYVAYFFLGFVAGRGRWLHREWLRDERAWPRLFTWGIAALVTMVAYLAVRLLVSPTQQSEPAVHVLNSVAFTTTVLAWVLFLLAVARCTLESRGPLWSRVARSSYWIYFFHPIFLYPVVLLMREVSWVPVAVKFPVAVIVAVTASWGVAEGAALIPRAGRGSVNGASV